MQTSGACSESLRLVNRSVSFAIFQRNLHWVLYTSLQHSNALNPSFNHLSLQREFQMNFLHATRSRYATALSFPFSPLLPTTWFQCLSYTVSEIPSDLLVSWRNSFKFQPSNRSLFLLFWADWWGELAYLEIRQDQSDSVISRADAREELNY